MAGWHRVRRREEKTIIRALVVGAAFLLIANVARAQSIEELEQTIRERDAKIEELKRRIESLEGKPAASPEGEEEVNRALERALVQQGGLLLRSGVYELEPQLVYSHWDKSRSALHDVTEAALAVRAGLGWQSQLQVRAPYVHSESATGSITAFGDLDLTLSKQLLRENKSIPSFVASLGWLTRTGRDAFAGVPTGGGFNVLQAGVTALKRQDPLVYYSGVSYAAPRSRNIDGNTLEPGHSVGVRLGGILAASPDSSVGVGLNLGFVGASRINGERIPDSDTILGTLQISFGTILTQSAMLNVSADLRVSGNVPDLRLGVTLPIRF